MKKFYILLSAVFALNSCTTDSSDDITAAPQLERVDFNPDNPNVRHWLFNAKGLLAEIRNVDNALIESFAYDSKDNMIQNIKYVNGTANATYIVTYNSNNIITHINGSAYNYSPSEQKYFFTEGNNTYECFVNSDLIMKESHMLYNDTVDQYHFDNYSNHNASGNLTGYTSSASFGGGPNCFYSHNDKTNPLRNAILSIVRAKSLYDPSFLASSLSSKNNIATLRYFSEDPETSQYHYDYNSNDLPTQQFCGNYYNGVYEQTYVSAKYYYQGDALP